MKTDEIRQQFEKLKQANEELSFLKDLSQSIDMTFGFDEIVKTIIKKSIRMVNAEQGTIVLVDNEGLDPKTLVRSVITLGRSRPFSLDQALVGWMVTNQKPLNLTDPGNDARFTGLRLDESIKSVACVPLLMKSVLIGVLTVFNKQDGVTFTDDDLRLLNIVASHSAQIVENARLHRIEQLHEELKATQTQLIQSKKMASLGALAAGLAHEINSPVGAIRGTNDVSARCISKMRTIITSCQGADGTAQLQPYLKQLDDGNQLVADAVQRIALIIGSLKSFVQLDGAPLQEFDLHEGLDSTLALLEHALGGRIDVVRQYGAIPRVTCNPAEINQVFMHLLSNAIQAIEGTGNITITTTILDKNVSIQIRDTGIGISEPQIRRLFDPVFTKKGSRVKVGLGLFTCSNIIEKCRGQISVDSGVGKGSVFTIVLPVGK